jgi:hypothetical protein
MGLFSGREIEGASGEFKDSGAKVFALDHLPWGKPQPILDLDLGLGREAISQLFKRQQWVQSGCESKERIGVNVLDDGLDVCSGIIPGLHRFNPPIFHLTLPPGRGWEVPQARAT